MINKCQYLIFLLTFLIIIIIIQESQGRRSSVLRCEKFWVESEQWTSAGAVTVSTPWLSTISTTGSTRWALPALWTERAQTTSSSSNPFWMNSFILMCFLKKHSISRWSMKSKSNILNYLMCSCFLETKFIKLTFVMFLIYSRF